MRITGDERKESKYSDMEKKGRGLRVKRKQSGQDRREHDEGRWSCEEMKREMWMERIRQGCRILEGEGIAVLFHSCS